MSRKIPAWLIPALFIVWLFFVLASFFAVQKPFVGDNALAIGNAALNLLVAGWLGLVGLGLGVWLLQRLMPTELSLIEVIIIGTGLGLGALGLVVLGLGLVGLFQPVVAYGVTLAFSIFLGLQFGKLFQYWHSESPVKLPNRQTIIYFSLIILLSSFLGLIGHFELSVTYFFIIIALSIVFAAQVSQLFQKLDWRPNNLPSQLTILYLSIIGFFALLLALLPPTDWDGLFYHLTGPKVYLQAGGIVGGFDVPHFNFPSLMEMLFAWAMLLRGDIAAKLIHAGFGLLLVGLVYITTRRLLGQKAAWPAVLILASMPMLGTLAGWAYNDLALAFYQLAGLYAIINSQLPNYQLTMNNEQNPETRNTKHETRSWLILSGLFAGLAMGLKYTSFITPLVIVLIISWFGLQRKQLTGTIIGIAIFSLVALLIALPWYVKNWVFTGNPVYPFLSGIFGGQYWDEFRATWYASAGTGIGWRPTTLLALPWLLTLGVRDVNYWDGRTGPLLLLFLPLIVWVSFSRRNLKRPPAFNLLLIYVLAHFSFWTLGVIWSRSLWQSRLLLPGLVGLIPVAGWVWINLSEFDLPRFSLSRFVNIAIGLTLALTIVDVGLLTLKINPIPYLVGLETREQHLTRRLGAHYATMQQINETSPPNAKVIFLWEPRSYYCQRDCRPDSILDSFPHLVYQHKTADAIAATWHDMGITHVLIHRTGLEFMLNEQPTTVDVGVLNRLERDHLKQIFDVVGAYQLYQLQGASR